MSHSSDKTAEAQIRRRTRQACEACKLRKRKCNGREPCDSCIRYEYECHYENHPRKKKRARAKSRRASSPSQTLSESPVSVPLLQRVLPESQTRSDCVEEKYRECNSGMVFPHVLGLKLNPEQAPKVHGFGWNLGLGGHPNHSERSITWTLPRAQWQRLFDVYEDKIHPLYGFLDLETVLAKAARRWEDPCVTNAYDHVLCGIAALGSFFSRPNASEQERHLVECAKDIMEMRNLSASPSLDDAEAWLLRTIYLRASSFPHAAWMASCTMMHILEALGIHQEAAAVSLVYSDAAVPNNNVEGRRRLFWLARALNTWISVEYGRTKVIFRGVSCQIPSVREGDLSTDLVSLFLLSERLEPEHDNRLDVLEDCLSNLENSHFSSDALTLSQCMVAFGIYRQLRMLNPNLEAKISAKLIGLGKRGLEASSRLADAHCPWWHVSNVPFQFTCLLLAMDTKESLTHIRDSIATLGKVADRFPTQMTRRALETVQLLATLSQKRKEHDIALLKEGIELQSLGPAVRNRHPVQPAERVNLTSDLSVAGAGLLDFSDLSDVDWNLLANNSFDLSDMFPVPEQRV
ncbi:uncharacterized protein Z520_04284 [Fonsecaea multimorphosa CBS 102226]|uniref:Zn(2)-C6 fungal-type domain-containing protein n=1 Tax=Fonsecaea multimorphosa CBS 102226 TaxID=1442371 RepID=A0A0D2K8W8_9EURO|nr:uncharacterized protein Z520_04284 [Fonsecaea multimorphosa CBS 102226]KIX99649.1 hypothetical protein Z520_04284 [Fonsecaea multimorphosa CBS 102226]OAL26701.1 hypothetical protein AYO22_04054 [Fonsecaea multimorphosa]